MTITKESRAYEILIRFNLDGSIGAQRQSIVEIMDDGLIISAMVEPPIALNLEEVKELVGGLSCSTQELSTLPIAAEDNSSESA